MPVGLLGLLARSVSGRLQQLVLALLFEDNGRFLGVSRVSESGPLRPAAAPCWGGGHRSGVALELGGRLVAVNHGSAGRHGSRGRLGFVGGPRSFSSSELFVLVSETRELGVELLLLARPLRPSASEAYVVVAEDRVLVAQFCVLRRERVESRPRRIALIAQGRLRRGRRVELFDRLFLLRDASQESRLVSRQRRRTTSQGNDAILIDTSTSRKRADALNTLRAPRLSHGWKTRFDRPGTPSPRHASIRFLHRSDRQVRLLLAPEAPRVEGPAARHDRAPQTQRERHQ